MKAIRNRYSSIVGLLKNNSIYATVLGTANMFVKREPLPAKPGRPQAIELAQPPSVAADYLSQPNPNDVFQKAFTFSPDRVVNGYVVIIDANNTRYAVEFDAAGNFVKAKTI